MNLKRKILLGVIIFFLIYAAACGTDLNILGMLVIFSIGAYIRISRWL